jgi:hypothetical protein
MLNTQLFVGSAGCVCIQVTAVRVFFLHLEREILEASILGKGWRSAGLTKAVYRRISGTNHGQRKRNELSSVASP